MRAAGWSLRVRCVLAAAMMACMLAASGCGFHLSRPPDLPFETLYVVAPSYSSMGAELKRYLASNSKTRLVDRPEQAEVTLHIITELYESQIVALSVAGRVNELQLRYRPLKRVGVCIPGGAAAYPSPLTRRGLTPSAVAT